MTRRFRMHDTKTIALNGKSYTISADLWARHCMMHPVRSEEALRSNLRAVYGKKPYSTSEIEESIAEEFDVQSRFGEIVLMAERTYDATR